MINFLPRGRWCTCWCRSLRRRRSQASGASLLSSVRPVMAAVALHRLGDEASSGVVVLWGGILGGVVVAHALANGDATRGVGGAGGLGVVDGAVGVGATGFGTVKVVAHDDVLAADVPRAGGAGAGLSASREVRGAGGCLVAAKVGGGRGNKRGGNESGGEGEHWSFWT